MEAIVWRLRISAGSHVTMNVHYQPEKSHGYDNPETIAVMQTASSFCLGAISRRRLMYRHPHNKSHHKLTAHCQEASSRQLRVCASVATGQRVRVSLSGRRM